MITYLAGSLSLIVLAAALLLVQVGFILTMAIISIVVAAIIAAALGLYAFITRVRDMAKGFG